MAAIGHNRIKKFIFCTIFTVLFCIWCPAQNDHQAKANKQRLRIPSNKHNHLRALPQFSQTPVQWRKRKKETIERLKIAMGLYPYLRLKPDSQKPKYKIIAEHDFQDFVLQNVTIELFPGFYILGNLYKPKKGNGPFPAIINSHGHWPEGRFSMDSLVNIPIRCANFAAMGMVAFSYDLEGYGESIQLSHWGFDYTLEQDLWGLSLMGLEALKGIRIVDFLTSLPFVDPGRIGMTGASGGGHHSVLVSAIDPRISAVATVNNTYFGLLAEDCCAGVPYQQDINECELSALVSPKAQLIITNQGDHTRNYPKLCQPLLQRIYSWDKAEKQLVNFRQNSPHNYNYQARREVYQFFARTLQKRDSLVQEKTYPLKKSNLRLFQSLKDYPASYTIDLHTIIENYRKGLIQPYLKRIQSLINTDFNRFKQIYSAISSVLFWQTNDSPAVKVGQPQKRGNYSYTPLFIKGMGGRYTIPVQQITTSPTAKGRALLVIFSNHGKNIPDSWQKLLAATFDLYTVDLFGQGDLTNIRWKDPLGAGRRATQYRRSCGFTAYDPTLAARRIKEITTVIAGLQKEKKNLHLLGTGKMGVLLLMARTQLETSGITVIDMNQFQDSTAQWLSSQYAVPLILRYGGIRIMANMICPGRLIIYNAHKNHPFDLLLRTYKNQNIAARLEIHQRSLPVNEIIAKIKSAIQ